MKGFAMPTTRRQLIGVTAAVTAYAAQGKNKVTRYVRYRSGSTTAYGILDGDTVHDALPIYSATARKPARSTGSQT